MEVIRNAWEVTSEEAALLAEEAGLKLSRRSELSEKGWNKLPAVKS